MLVFRHPKFYAELRKKRKQFQASQEKMDQVISETKPTGDGERAPGSGPKPQASSSKPQAKPEPSSGS